MIKKGLLLILFVFGTFLVTYISFHLKKYNPPAVNSSYLKSGDLILRCGRSTESYAVYLADKNSEFTHIGIIAIENEIPYVIHAVPHKDKFVKKESLTSFLKSKSASKFAVYRCNLNSNILNNVTKEALSFYTKKYTFDTEYDLSTNTKLYCSELVLKAFKNSGILLNIDIQELNYIFVKHQIIFPSAFTRSPFFNKII